MVGSWMVACQSPPEAGAERSPHPNIVVILADDLGFGDLACYGQERFTTPHLDQMAAEGIRFLRHYAGSTVCAPSRSSLMTGLHTGHTPIRGIRKYSPKGRLRWPRKHSPWPSALKVQAM